MAIRRSCRSHLQAFPRNHTIAHHPVGSAGGGSATDNVQANLTTPAKPFMPLMLDIGCARKERKGSREETAGVVSLGFRRRMINLAKPEINQLRPTTVRDRHYPVWVTPLDRRRLIPQARASEVGKAHHLNKPQLMDA